jgi:hypothetical protein
MPQTEARAWWDDVQHVREAIERRRGATDHASGEVTAVRDSTGLSDDSPLPDDAVPAAPRRRERAERRERDGARPERVAEPRWEREGARPEPVEPRSERAEPRRERDEARWQRAAEPRRERVAEPLATRRHAHDAGAESRRTPATHTVPGAATVRRTVRITGRPDDRFSTWRPMEIDRRRPPRRPAERVGHRPDRIALWAVLLGFFLILVAAASSHGAG